jgi:Protein of unknown function (DUF2846)
MFRLLFAALACVSVAACASSTTTAFEPQHRALGAGQARIYVIRPETWAGHITRYDVLVDDKPVGELAAGSYLSVDRPAGQHKVSVTPPSILARVEHEFHAAAGRSYYFVINIKSSESAVVSGSFVMAIPMPGTSIGRPVKEGNFLSGLYLSVLDAAEGRAMLSRLKAP